MAPSQIINQLPNTEENEDPFGVLTPAFMEGRTDSPNFAHFIEDSPWEIRDGDITSEDGSPAPLDEFNRYVAEHSRCASWTELVEEATEYWDSELSPEERAKKRRDCHIEPIQIETSYQEGKGTLVDISVQGVGLKTSMRIKPGGWLKITIPKKHTKDVDSLPHRTLQLRGLIRWVGHDDSHFRAGVELTARLL